MRVTLYYVHDPMCSWCWAFRPTWQRIVAALPSGVEVQRLVGGLAPDTDLPMPEAMRGQLQATWQRIQQVVPGTRFNFAFWSDCAPRRATYPACRAVVAAGRQGEQHSEPMVSAIQHAYYLEARNPSDDSTLKALAGEIGLDPARFAADLADPATQAEVERQISQARGLGADSFPSLVLVTPAGTHGLMYDYNEPAAVLNQLEQLLAAA
ncbi:MAG: DsbA family protein [Gammaproteobacteria bacterium]|nr:MAG: DsbA family protein [Gammaproteobacteria bacterium]